MAWVNEDIVTISGITATSTGNRVSISKTNSPMFTAGAFGVSVTTYTAGNWTVALYTKIGSGTRLLIAESAAITGASAVYVPIIDSTAGATTVFNGVPMPFECDVTASSGGVGITWSGIVSASLLDN